MVNAVGGAILRSVLVACASRTCNSKPGTMEASAALIPDAPSLYMC